VLGDLLLLLLAHTATSPKNSSQQQRVRYHISVQKRFHAARPQTAETNGSRTAAAPTDTQLIN
jgi:hypothetical protein